MIDARIGGSGDEFLETVFLFPGAYLDWEGPEGHPGVNVQVFDNPDALSAKDLAAQHHRYTNFSDELELSSGVTATGLEFLYYPVVGLYEYDYYLFEFDGKLYVFSAYDNSSEADAERVDLRSTILDTLLFEGGEAEVAQIYTNTAHGFKVTVPEGFKVKTDLVMGPPPKPEEAGSIMFVYEDKIGISLGAGFFQKNRGLDDISAKEYTMQWYEDNKKMESLCSLNFMSLHLMD